MSVSLEKPAGGPEAFGQLRGQFFAGQRNHLGTPPPALSERQIDIAARGQGDDAEALWIRFNDREGAGPDGTGGTEDAKVLQRKLARWKYC